MVLVLRKKLALTKARELREYNEVPRCLFLHTSSGCAVNPELEQLVLPDTFPCSVSIWKHPPNPLVVLWRTAGAASP